MEIFLGRIPVFQLQAKWHFVQKSMGKVIIAALPDEAGTGR